MRVEEKRQVVKELVKRGMKVKRAVERVGLARSTFYYQGREREGEEELREKIRQVALAYPSFGYRRIWAWLRREGWGVNRKRVWRLYRQLDLGLRRPRKKKGRKRGGEKFAVKEAEEPQERWAVDLTEVWVERGYRVRILNVLDEATRYYLGFWVGRHIGGVEAGEVLEQLCRRYGPPRQLRRDNGPEFQSKAFQAVVSRWRIGEVVIPPGRPYWNGAVESFHSTLEKELLGREIFQNEQELRAKLAAWQQYYNGRRLHSALGYQTPEERWHQLTLKNPLDKEDKKELSS